jgi:hypothetical protein
MGHHPFSPVSNEPTLVVESPDQVHVLALAQLFVESISEGVATNE